MAFLGGLTIAILSIYAAVLHLEQQWASYWDFVAFACVIGGTIAVSVITVPWAMWRELLKRSKDLVIYTRIPAREFLKSCLGVIQARSSGTELPDVPGRRLHSQILRDGIELIQLGFSRDDIANILEERVFQSMERARKIANSIRSLSKYPPAFGLAGTVLGLVHLMRGVSEGMNPQETGYRMAIALVATFYGLLISNLIVNPAGEAIKKMAEEEEGYAEIALQAVLLASDQTHLLKAQEMLNSYVAPENRVDWMESSNFADGQAA